MDAMLADEMDEWLWPESCAELRDMESALRCQICGDFFHGPVLLPCTHTFCSECVRRFLQSRGNNGCCPECKQPCSPGELVPNRTLEKIGVLFQQMKPKVLPVLEKAKGNGKAAATPAADTGKANGDGKPPERMPLLSYNVMKEKDIKKLLESIGIRALVKNRDDIIQIHKEYVLLANAQADSSHPKSAKQVREEVMRNYRARQAEKQSGGGARKSLDAAQVPVVTAEMQAGFERLRQQVKARNGKQKAKQEDDEDEDKPSTHGVGGTDSDNDDDDDDRGHGIWRHVHVVKSGVDFYIHSKTQEIRTEPPREFLEHQQRLRQQRERDAAAAADKDTDDDDEPVVLGTRSAPTSQTEVTEIVSADDDDDFEIMITSPPPKPPLGSRNSTPQSTPASARKTAAERRRSSVGSVGSSSNGGAVPAFFSQETSCSIQETSTQMAPSASMSLPSQMSSSAGSARAGPGFDLSASSPSADSTPGSQTLPLTETKWVCPRCTLVNDTVGAVAECEACGYQHRPARKKQKLQFQSKLFPT